MSKNGRERRRLEAVKPVLRQVVLSASLEVGTCLRELVLAGGLQGYLSKSMCLGWLWFCFITGFEDEIRLIEGVGDVGGWFFPAFGFEVLDGDGELGIGEALGLEVASREVAPVWWTLR